VRRGGVVAAWAAVLAAVLAVLVSLPWRPLEHLDQGSVESVHRLVLTHRWVFRLAQGITHAGDPLVVTVVSVIAAGLLLALRHQRAALYLLATRALAALLSTGLKTVVDRPRPVLDHPLAHATGLSFPSGHALGSAALWGSLAVVLVVRLPGGVRLALAVAVPLLVAASRVFLGVHFPTDVVAGLALGWALSLALADLLAVGPPASPSIAATVQVNAE
jgi:undecaprenyl-diphosphatase